MLVVCAASIWRWNAGQFGNAASRLQKSLELLQHRKAPSPHRQKHPQSILKFLSGQRRVLPISHRFHVSFRPDALLLKGIYNYKAIKLISCSQDHRVDSQVIYFVIFVLAVTGCRSVSVPTVGRTLSTLWSTEANLLSFFYYHSFWMNSSLLAPVRLKPEPRHIGKFFLSFLGRF